MSHVIKYRYAFDSKNKLVDVRELERSTSPNSEKYYSIDFKTELIPKLGEIKKKHFSSKPNHINTGTNETYLHALGKQIFLNEYKKCIENRIPFYLTYPTIVVCNRLKSEFNLNCRLEDRLDKFDLTKYFPKIQEEKKDGDFIPDLKIFNPESNQKIYIEIAVSHSSSDDKINSGIRIIEFHLKNEDDIQNIIDFKNGNHLSDRVDLFNFKYNEDIGFHCISRNCNIHYFNFFCVSTNGKCLLFIKKEREIYLYVNKYKHNSIWHIIEPTKNYNGQNADRPNEIFKEYIALAYKKNVKLKNCFICKYHAKDNSWNSSLQKPIFCKFRKIKCSSNEASNCKYFNANLNVLLAKD